MGELADQMRAYLDGPRTPRTMPASTARLDVTELWPELFDGLDPLDVQGIRDACVANWHEGWKPNPDDVADLVARAKGEISSEELGRRAAQRATRAKAAQ